MRTGFRRRARRGCGRVDDILEPERLETQFGAELGHLGLHRVVHKRARDDRDRCGAMLRPTSAGGRGIQGR